MKNFKTIAGLASLALLLIITSHQSQGQSGKTFIVNSLGDAGDTDAGLPGDDGICSTGNTLPNGEPECTFRAAIQNHNANRHLDQNRIEFDIDLTLHGASAAAIQVSSSLPPVLGSVVISGFNNFPNAGSSPVRVELDGSQAGNAIGLQLLGANCEIKWLVIHSFSSHGIYIGGTPSPGGGGHTIENTFIGTDITGSQNRGNGGDGIYIDDTPDNIIGKKLAKNVISGNQGYGIRIVGQDPEISGHSGSGAPNNKVQGNLIGLSTLGDAALPNALGGIFMQDVRDNTIGGTEDEEGNEVVGVENGITVEGSLSDGIVIQGNSIGKDGLGTKFKVGILHKGKLISIERNLLTNIDSVGIEAFLNFDGIYNLKENQFEGEMKTGIKLDFGPGRKIDVIYQSNFHLNNKTGVEFRESAQSTINWVVSGNEVRNGQSGGLLEIKANGKKDFTNNIWEVHAEIGFQYVMDVASDVKATVIVNGGIFDKNGLDGVSFRGSIKGEVSYSLFNFASTNNGRNGVRLEVFADAGSTVILESSDLEVSFSAGAGLRLANESSSVDILKGFIEKSNIHDNVVGIEIFNWRFGNSVKDNNITNNTQVGILLNGGSEVRIAENHISGNCSGIIIEDSSRGELDSNTLTGNGAGLILTGSAQGTSLRANSIFANSGLGIDLGNDGVSPNDPGDTDTGPNSLQNFPVLTSATFDNGNINVQGVLDSSPNANFSIEFFSNAACDPSGFGEGQVFLGSHNLLTEASGQANFSVVLPDSGSFSNFLTAIATDSLGNSSEFCQCVEITSVNVITGINNHPNENSLVIYPNPVGDIITIETNLNWFGSTYSITNTLGKVVRTGKLTSEISRVSMSRVPAGLYMLIVEGEVNKTFKVVRK